jgi:hypothetical protein
MRADAKTPTYKIAAIPFLTVGVPPEMLTADRKADAEPRLSRRGHANVLAATRHWFRAATAGSDLRVYTSDSLKQPCLKPSF